jgi:cell division septal protein FtsQ
VGSLSYGVYYIVFISSFFKIAHINITGTKSFVNLVDITEVAKENVSGLSIFRVDSGEAEKKLLEAFQGAKDIKVGKRYPSTISVKVFERSPVALVHNSNSEEYFLVDEDGYILGIIDRNRTNLPEIKYEGEIKVGTFVDKRMVPLYMELVNALNEEKLRVSSMSFYPKYALVYINDGIETYISNDRDKTESIRTASALIKQLLLEGKKIEKIDLRYDKVIVSYE